MRRSLLAAASAMAVVCSAASAQAAGDLTGLWFIERTGAPPNLPLTPAAREIIATDRARVADGLYMNERSTRCLPTAMPIMMSNEFGLNILQVQGQIAMLSENNIVPRLIYTDGRKHPAEPMPSWNGHAIASWEGETLVVDTVGFNDRFAVFFGGVRRTPTLHVVERIHLEDGGKVMINEMTVEDPATFTQPVTQTFRYNRLPADAEYMEYVCEVQLPDLQRFEEWNAKHAAASASAETPASVAKVDR